MKRIVFILCCLLSGVCGCKSPELREALRLAGGNRPELERVLDHFSRDRADSLKLKGAVFLIENMPGHYSLTAPGMERYMREVDSLYPDYSQNMRKMMQALPFYAPDVAGSFVREEDVESLKADFLIRHIERVFEKRERYSWLQELCFKDFCDYMLPYRVGFEQPVFPVDSMDAWFSRESDDLLHYDNIKNDPRLVVSAVFLKWCTEPAQVKSFVYEGVKTECEVDCNLISLAELWSYKLLGIPGSIDLILHFPFRNDRHCWCSMADYWSVNGVSSPPQDRRVGKVYRATFARNAVPKQVEGEYIPEVFLDPFLRDVTEKYVKAFDVKVGVENPDVADSYYAYLSVFNDLEWRPVAVGERGRRHAFFSKIGGGVVYLPVVFSGQQPEAYSWPFLLKSDGGRRVFKPDTLCRVSLDITRKYPISDKLASYDNVLPGALVEASDSPEFTVRDTLYVIPEKSYYRMTSAGISPARAYRYWRLNNPSRFFYLSEVQFYGPDGRRLEGVPVASPKNFDVEKIFDGDPLSYGFARSWVGMDFGAPVDVAEVRYLPRNDANGVYPGNTYELFYYDLSGWVSLGAREATDYSLRYDNVPRSALLWLRNLTGGVEERIFSYENGAVKFW